MSESELFIIVLTSLVLLSFVILTKRQLRKNKEEREANKGEREQLVQMLRQKQVDKKGMEQKN